MQKSWHQSCPKVRFGASGPLLTVAQLREIRPLFQSKERKKELSSPNGFRLIISVAGKRGKVRERGKGRKTSWLLTLLGSTFFHERERRRGENRSERVKSGEEREEMRRKMILSTPPSIWDPMRRGRREEVFHSIIIIFSPFSISFSPLSPSLFDLTPKHFLPVLSPHSTFLFLFNSISFHP